MNPQQVSPSPQPNEPNAAVGTSPQSQPQVTPPSSTTISPVSTTTTVETTVSNQPAVNSKKSLFSNKALLIGVIAVVLIAVGAGLYLFLNMR